ncbi:GPI-anchored protein PB15E9.01c [Biomphalaria pfeifferi]|uniref:GPI-anchored protein PB15E9.01c n=1 Tax=Biomphalaria pfeifferi TaxID=112525 RepID=A0AAD8FAA7_BIOPF|nr:GPI-anchored protein PB15E9.01c [Biomphalaria pfeifferi]
MEKRRRARINASLSELKGLLQEAIKREGARHNKMEKADILEMAVKHLKQIQRQQTDEPLTEHLIVNKYTLGFNACAQEVSKYLEEDVELKTKLLNHLANCLTGASVQSAGCSSSSSSLMDTSSMATMSTPMSPLSIGTISPSSTSLSPESQRSLQLDAKSSSPSFVKSLEFSSFGSLDHRVSNFVVPQSLEMNASNNSSKVIEGYSTKIVSTPPLPASVCSSTSENAFSDLVNSPQASFGRHAMADLNNNGKPGKDVHDNQPISEINNNIITIPTVMGLRGALQQPQQQLQIQPVHQIHQLSDISLDHNQQAILQESNIMSNRLQLIPVKIANGETALVLSTANIMNQSGYSFQVYAPQSQPQIFAQPLQIAQIAVAFPQEEQQPTLTYIPQVNQPHSVLSSAFNATHSKPSIGFLDNQSAPLNLTASNHKSSTQHYTPTSTPLSVDSLNAMRTHETFPISRASAASAEAAFPTTDDQDVRYNECTSTTMSNNTSSLRNNSPGLTHLESGDFTLRRMDSFNSYVQRQLCSMSQDMSACSVSTSTLDTIKGSPVPQDLRQEYRPQPDTYHDKKPDFFRPW